jgi:NADH-quinone oxidoreductase subunit N
MDFSNFMIMRQEVLLVLLALLILILDLAFSDSGKQRIIHITLILFAAITVSGFFSVGEGELFGGMYRNNALTIQMKNILNIAMLIIFLQSVQWLKKEEIQSRASEYLIILLSTLIGMGFMISSGDFLMFYIGLELASIPATILAAFDKSSQNGPEAGIKYIFSSALSSGFLLLGISFIYGTTGSIYFTEVFSNMGTTSLHLLGFIFFLSGMGFKISLVPFHFWTADVYEGAPVNITAYLSVISKGAAVFILTILLYKVFPVIESHWQTLLYILAISTMTLGNLFAIRQNNLKRFMAFSSIAQAGFILLGILGGGQIGMATVVYFVLIYVFTNLAAFGVISSIYHQTGKDTIDSYNGLYRTNPLLSLTLMLALFSLAGIPPVAGFFGKFFLFTAAAGKGYFILVLIAVLNATISLYYYLKVIKAMFIDRNDQPIAYFKSDIYCRISLVICILCVFFTGFFGGVYEFIFRIAKVL